MFCTHCKEPFNWTKTNWSGTSDSVYLDNAEGVEKTVLEALVVCTRTDGAPNNIATSLVCWI